MAAHAAFGRLPGVDRPALATIIPTRQRPAVLLDCGATVECRPQHLVQFALMGSAYARVALGLRVAAGRPAVGRRGREQGQRADARGAPAAQGRAGQFHRQRRGARRLRRRRRRDRLRRLHRQRHAEDQRGAGRDGRDAAARRAVGDLRRRGSATCCRGRRSAASAAASTTRSSAARRSLGLNGLCIVGHGRSSSKAVRNAVPWPRGSPNISWLTRLAPRRSRWRAGLRTRHHHDCVRVSGTGRAAGRHGPLAGRRSSESAATTFAEADAALGEPLSALCFEGPDDRLQLTENTQPAILAVSVAACRLVESRGVRAAFAAGHSLGEYSAHVAAGTLSFADALSTVRRRGQLHAGGGAGRRGRDGRASSGSTRTASRRPACQMPRDGAGRSCRRPT